jgi:hypothetical protein
MALDAEARAKGIKALAKWRKEKAAAKAKGPEFFAKWQASRKKTGPASPLQAIKQFCLYCVGDSVEDVRKCNASKCPLYNLRPYK